MGGRGLLREPSPRRPGDAEESLLMTWVSPAEPGHLGECPLGCPAAPKAIGGGLGLWGACDRARHRDGIVWDAAAEKLALGTGSMSGGGRGTCGGEELALA